MGGAAIARAIVTAGERAGEREADRDAGARAEADAAPEAAAGARGGGRRRRGCGLRIAREEQREADRAGEPDRERGEPRGARGPAPGRAADRGDRGEARGVVGGDGGGVVAIGGGGHGGSVAHPARGTHLAAPAVDRRRVAGLRGAALRSSTMRAFLASLLLLCACSNGGSPDSPDAGVADTAPPLDSDDACPAGKAGAACVLARHTDALAGCDPGAVARLRAELVARRGLGPLWAGGRALFHTDAPIQIAGSFNEWSPTALASTPVCGSELAVAVADVASGAWQYKLTDGAVWTLDPHNPAFAYDDFPGNADGRNSALVTPDAGRGQLIALPEACSTSLGNCRRVTAYLPPGYDAPAAAARRYPVVFLHDGQNVWDDHDCCFGHTGWELNVTLDTEIAAGRVAPVIAIAADHTPDRNNEYGLSLARMAIFMQFQVTELQPAALTRVRWDGERVAIAGSSLGGLVALELALRYPQTYRGAASLSGAFWPGQDSGTAMRDRLPQLGKQPVAVYLDHGGIPAQNTDGAADSIEIRDLLDGLGWSRQDSPACTAGPDALCYFTEPGATHDELAWKARAWRFLRFLAAP